MSQSHVAVSRRTFIKKATAGSLAALAAPAIVAADKTNSKKPILGDGEHQYEANHYWAQLPDRYTWQTTQDITIGRDGLVYVIHKGHLEKEDHPAIFAFDSEGKFVRAFGQLFQGGGHGLEMRQEGSDEFLYVTAYQSKRSFAKLTPRGEIVWHKFAPMEAGGYADGENASPRKRGDNPRGRDHFEPTNFAFLPDGGFLLADGYGSYRIHRYDKQGTWLSCFGKPTDGEAKPVGAFNLPHGLWIDDRGDEPLIVVTDRMNARLQWFTLDGQHRRTQDGFLLPANADIRGEILLIPDLAGRVTLLDGKNQVIAHLGDDSQRIKNDKETIRADESRWISGKFVHPHDACFDAEGNILVAEWVERGRITKLRKVT